MNKALKRQLQKLGLTLSQAEVLWLVGAKREVSVSGIARFLGRETNSVSQLVDRMEGQDLVRREKAGSKGRFAIKLTNKGKELSKQAEMVGNICDMMCVLTQEECSKLASQLQLLRGNAVRKLAREIAESIEAEYSDLASPPVKQVPAGRFGVEER